MRSNFVRATFALALLTAASLVACKKEENKPTPVYSTQSAPSGTTAGKKIRAAYVTNGVADFWSIAKAGAEAAGDELDVEVTVIMPSGLQDQKNKIEDLLVRGTDGIAISPIQPADQVEVINKACEKTNVITHDSDAPGTNRLAYVGMDNYKAGLMCGEMVRQVLPEGGTVMIFIGRTEQDNAKLRRQGTIDAILGREPDRTRQDPPGETLKSADGKYTILGTLTDGFDRVKAKANAEDTLSRYPDISCMVGLFEYNPPLILEALDRANKLGKVKVVGFDEAQVTLEAIKSGNVFGTVVQDPYNYGYQSVKLLKALASGDQAALPEGGFLDIPARKITQDNVEAFMADLQAKIGK